MRSAVVRESVTAGGAGAGGPHSWAGCPGPGHLCQDVAVLLVGELSGSSVQRSRSADPGEAVTLAVRAGDGLVWVEVLDGGARAPELRWAGRDAEGGPRASACGGPGGTVGVADGLLPGLSCGAAKYPEPGVTTRYWRQVWVRDAHRSVQTQLQEVNARSMRGTEERASCKGSSQTPGCVRYGPSGGPQTR